MTTTATNQAWIDDFILALRLRSVRGDAIGDAVAVVRAHLADSGESAAEAFGNARTYAASLELPTVAQTRAGDPPVMGTAVSLLAVFAFAPAVSAIAAGTRLEFSLPQLLLWLVPAAAVLGLPAYFHLAVRHLWVFAAVFGAAVVAATGTGFFAPERGYPLLVSVGPWWVAIGSGAVLLAASGWAVVDAIGVEPDDIVDPARPQQRRPTWGHRLLGALPHLLVPGVALACVVGAAVTG